MSLQLPIKRNTSQVFSQKNYDLSQKCTVLCIFFMPTYLSKLTKRQCRIIIESNSTFMSDICEETEKFM